MNARIIKPIDLIFFIIIILAHFQVNAQEKEYARQGVLEISGTISYSSYTPVFNGISGESKSIFTIAPQVGFFAVDGFEISLGTGFSYLPGISVISPAVESSTSVVQLFFAPSYNFRTENEKLFPFIEGQIGYTSLSQESTSMSGLSYGGHAGLKIVIADHLLLSISAQYFVINLNNELFPGRSGFNYFTIGMGISGFL